MPFQTLSSDGIDIACFLVDHDWNTKLSISHFFGGNIATGLSNRESRRPEAEALLLSVGLKIWAEDDEAQALRQQFATLGSGWVGFPILSDQFLGSDYSTPGARIYDPQRLLDLTVPAIVTPNSSAPWSGLEPDHTYAALVVGHITSLPPIEPETGGLCLCSCILTEDSSWTFRVGVNATVATGTWPDTLEPDWTTPPKQTPTSGLTFARIGLQREQTIDDLERAFVWTCQADFTLCDKTEIATLLAFFVACRGQWASFDASLWFQPGTATAEAPNSTTVRFTDRTLKLDFITPTLAEAKIGFTQLPWEIAGTAGETPQEPPRIFLYQFTYDVPGAVIWRYTNCWRSLTRTNDGTYDPAPIDHESISGGLDLSNEDVKLQSFLIDSGPWALFNPCILEGKLWLRIYEIETDPIDADSAQLVWFGSISEAPEDGRKVNATGKWLGGILDRQVPALTLGPMCGTYFLAGPCGHTKAEWAKPGTLSSSSDTTVVVATGDAASQNTYGPGKLEVGSGLTFESRMITASVPVSGGQQLTLDRPLRQAASGQAVTYYRTCDRTKASCKLLDPVGWQGRFRGQPNIPVIQFTLPQVSQAPAGKK